MSNDESNTTVGFAGLGRMGSEMSRHLIEGGFDVLGYDPSSEASGRFAAQGGRVAATPQDLAGASVIMSSLPATAEMLGFYELLIPRLEPESLCIDLSTVSVEASRRVAGLAAEHSVEFLDAPVSGTSTHAAAGTLVIMVGGSAPGYERALPLLEPFASLVRHCGTAGMGLEMKLITNRLLTAHLGAIAEAIVELEDAGLDVADSLELLRAGAVPRLLEYKAGPMAERDYTPLFTVALMGKDLRLADERRPPGRVTAAGAEMMRAALDAGLGDSDIAAIMEIARGTSA
jgi:3-hydroxyisobutyrate dehydrogenase-like beta-hydroxyacid dehydrogenase